MTPPLLSQGHKLAMRISDCSPLEIVDFKWLLNEKYAWRSCWANTMKMAHAGKKSSTSDLHNSGKYYQFTFRPKKIKSYGKLESKCIFSICMFVSDFSKVWQMKFRLWHVILTEICNMSPGQKNLESCQTNVLEQSLSSPLAFPILVNIKPYQKYTKITQNAVFIFWGAKFGVLPFFTRMPLLEASEKNYPLWRGSVFHLTFKSVGESD